MSTGATRARRAMTATAGVFARYNLGARWYDVLSAERPVYRAPRLAGVAQLRLRPGDRVLDVGCGTGLNFAPLRDAVGPDGRIVGIDRSAKMLRQARARNESIVRTVEADAARLHDAVDGPFDAVLFTYSLSIIHSWRAAFTQALQLTRPGARAVIVDLALPRGGYRLLWPLARIACWTGGVDPYRAPWRLIGETCDNVTSQTRRGGHVRVVAGTRR